MAGAVGEARHLVLDGGAVARAATGNRAAVNCGAVQVGADQGVRRLGGGGHPAGDLGGRDALGQGAEGLGRVVAAVLGQAVPGDAGAVQPGGGAGLQAAEREVQAGQGVRQADRWGLADPSGRGLGGADMDHAAQEGAGGQDRRGAGVAGAVGRADRGQAAIRGEFQVFDRGFGDGEVRGLGQQVLDGGAIQGAVGLGARAADRGALAAVQELEMDPRPVGGAGHQAVQRVDLPHQVALADAADGGVAGHLPDRGAAMGEQEGARAHAGGSGGGLRAGVAAADDDDVVGEGHGGLCPLRVGGAIAEGEGSRAGGADAADWVS